MTGRVLVTGASGFVGRQILPHLAAYEVHAVSRQSRRRDGTVWHAADLRDPLACRRLIAAVRPDILIHAAWETEHGAFWEADSNRDWLEAGKELFQAMVESGGARIVSLGTCAEYPTLDRPTTEADEALNPSTLYGLSKLALLNHLRGLGISHAWARIFHAYGPGEGPRRFVPQVARALAEGQPARCSSGRQLRDLMDVRDMGRAIASLAASDLSGAINLGSGEPVRLGDVARMLGEIAGRSDLVRLGALPDRPGEAEILIPDLTRQTRELGFRPRIRLGEGLRDAYDHWARALGTTELHS